MQRCRDKLCKKSFYPTAQQIEHEAKAMAKEEAGTDKAPPELQRKIARLVRAMSASQTVSCWCAQHVLFDPCSALLCTSQQREGRKEEANTHVALQLLYGQYTGQDYLWFCIVC